MENMTWFFLRGGTGCPPHFSATGDAETSQGLPPGLRWAPGPPPPRRSQEGKHIDTSHAFSHALYGRGSVSLLVKCLRLHGAGFPHVAAHLIMNLVKTPFLLKLRFRRAENSLKFNWASLYSSSLAVSTALIWAGLFLIDQANTLKASVAPLSLLKHTGI